MKLLVAVIRDDVSEKTAHALTAADFRVTSVASSGGFLRKGNTTLLVGLEEETMKSACDIIRTTVLANRPEGDNQKAVMLVLAVKEFEHF
ncbi:MAG TPA: cyclic-di-AMP receptor [Bellilinea sp.]|nr:cyclic-di-AMP receptor [Bellilinea sp.]